MELIGEVEAFLTWAMAWSHQCQEDDDKRGRRDVAPPAASPPAEQWVFAPSGNGYFIAGLGESGHLGRYKGLADIARLIRTPGKPVPILELIGADIRLKTDRRSRQPTVDAQGVQDILAQLAELRADRGRAQAANNLAEADAVQTEIEKLESYLAAAAGVKGKVRDLNNLYDKLRPKIHGRLGTAYKAMRAATPPMKNLADHFDLSISAEAGSGFVYRPAGAPPPWKFSQEREK
jgi:hypothetical protein